MSRCRRDPSLLAVAVAVGTAAAAVLVGCSAGGEVKTAPPTPQAAQDDPPVASAADPSDGKIGMSPGGVTTRVDEPAESTEEQYAQACMVAREWMDARSGDPQALIEPYLKEVQASTETGRAAFQKTWPELTGAQQAAVIIAVRAAADGGC